MLDVVEYGGVCGEKLMTLRITGKWADRKVKGKCTRLRGKFILIVECVREVMSMLSVHVLMSVDVDAWC